MKARFFIIVAVFFSLLSVVCLAEQEAQSTQEEQRLQRLERMFIRMNNFQGAIEVYNQAMEITQTPAYVLHSRAKAYLALEEFEKSIEDLTKAIELNPDEPRFIAQCYNDRAVVYFGAEQYEECWQDVQKALSLGYDVPADFLSALETKGYSQ